MFCSHCGKEISSNDNFCKYCGNKIEYKNIGDSASETKSPKTKRSSKTIIIGGILGLMLCVFFVVFFVVYSQKNKSSNLNKTDLKLSSEEAIVADVKTAGRLQSATQAALADERAYAAVCKFCGNDWNDDVLIMTINKNGEYIYSEDLNIFAEEFKSTNNYGNNDDKISIKYTEKGADSFNIYITPQGGVCVYIGSKDEPRKWAVIPFADTLYQVNIEEEKTSKEEASEIRIIETIDDAKEADVKTAGILQSIAQATLADEKAYSEVANYCDKKNKKMKDVLLLTIIDNEHITYVDELKYFAEEIRSNLSDDIRIYYKEKGAVLYSIYFTPEGWIKVYAGTKEKNDMWELVPNTDKLYSVNKAEYAEESNDLIDDEVQLYNMVVNYSADDVETNYDRLDANKPRYYHFSIDIPSKKTIKLYGGTTDSTGKSGYVDFTSESYDEESDFICMNSTMKTPEGTERVRIYRLDTGELLYEFVVDLYNDKPASDPEMLFPNCIVEYIPENEVKKLTKDQVQEVINDIYAKYGYIFKDKELREHYSQFSWYVERAGADHFSEEVFNEVAKANLELLKRYR